MLCQSADKIVSILPRNSTGKAPKPARLDGSRTRDLDSDVLRLGQNGTEHLLSQNRHEIQQVQQKNAAQIGFPNNGNSKT